MERFSERKQMRIGNFGSTQLVYLYDHCARNNRIRKLEPLLSPQWRKRGRFSLASKFITAKYSVSAHITFRVWWNFFRRFNWYGSIARNYTLFNSKLISECKFSLLHQHSFMWAGLMLINSMCAHAYWQNTVNMQSTSHVVAQHQRCGIGITANSSFVCIIITCRVQHT